MDWLGLWNERPWGTPAYVKQLREAMDAEGFTATKLVLGDGGMPNVLDYKNDTEFMASFEAVGLHYPCTDGALKGQGPGARPFLPPGGPAMALFLRVPHATAMRFSQLGELCG